MGIIVGLTAAASVVGLYIYRKMSPSLDSLLEKATQSRDVGKVLENISKRSQSQRPNVYNRAIRALWDRYERELAVAIVRELARNHKEARITQYWLKQVQQVEPRLAREQLGEEFYETFFLPELAAQCGSAG